MKRGTGKAIVGLGLLLTFASVVVCCGPGSSSKKKDSVVPPGDFYVLPEDAFTGPGDTSTDSKLPPWWEVLAAEDLFGIPDLAGLDLQAEVKPQGLPTGSDLEDHRNLAVALTGDAVPNAKDGSTFAHFGKTPQIADKYKHNFLERTRVAFSAVMDRPAGKFPFDNEGVWYYYYYPSGEHEVDTIVHGGGFISFQQFLDWWVIGQVHDFVLASNGRAVVLHEVYSEDTVDPEQELVATVTSAGLAISDFHMRLRHTSAPYGGQFGASEGYPPIEELTANVMYGDKVQMAFVATLGNVEGSKHDPTTRAIMAEWDTSKFAVVAEVGQHPWGSPEGAVFGFPNGHWANTFSVTPEAPRGPCLNGNNTLLYSAMLDWPKRYPGLVKGLFYDEKDGSTWSSAYDTQILAIDYEPLPGLGEAWCNGLSSAPPDLNNAGKVVYIANVAPKEGGTAFKHSLLTWQNGENQIVAQADQAAPGISGDWQFAGFGNPVVNSTGIVAFSASVRREVQEDQFETKVGVWTHGPNGLKLVAHDGMVVPSYSDGVQFYMPNLPVKLAMNSEGQVAFWSQLKGDDASLDDSGIYVANADSTLVQVARRGHAMVVRPDVVRTPVAFNIALGSGGEDGRKRCLNDNKSIVYHVQFEEGDEAIMLTDLTAEPDD